MPSGIVNPEATLIPDEAEVWVALKSDVTDITAMIPASVDDDLLALGWSFGGYVDAEKGISIEPSIDVNEYDAFGHPSFRVKLKKGKLKTGFTLLETNETTRKIVLPGSSANRIGAPRDVQIYALYKFVDEDRATIWTQLTPAPIEQSGDNGIIDGELRWFEMTVHHTTNAVGDVFQVTSYEDDDVAKTFTIDPAVTAYTVTVDGQTTASITAKTAVALQSALRALSTVVALPDPGVTVTGPTGGPLVATFTDTVTTVTATGTGGTVTVS